ncbi:hypothetical protein [Paenibacillus taichungensis]
MKNNDIGFEEIRITRRTDGQGFMLKAKGVFNGEPSIIEIPRLQQPQIDIDQNHIHDKYLFGKLLYAPRTSTILSFNAELKPENEIYYSVQIDPKHHAINEIEKMKSAIEDIRSKSEEGINALLSKIEELKKSL